MQNATSSTKPMVRGAATCALDQAYAPPAQSRPSRIRVALLMKSPEPMGSQAQM
jgi:hypothetical protein